VGHYSFHPLKAGRRRSVGVAEWIEEDEVSIPSRRVGDPVAEAKNNGNGKVSIPSRRVGDILQLSLIWVRAVFPSPQGGSETVQQWVTLPEIHKFPSPQGGSETRVRVSRGLTI